VLLASTERPASRGRRAGLPRPCVSCESRSAQPMPSSPSTSGTAGNRNRPDPALTLYAAIRPSAMRLPGRVALPHGCHQSNARARSQLHRAPRSPATSSFSPAAPAAACAISAASSSIHRPRARAPPTTDDGAMIRNGVKDAVMLGAATNAQALQGPPFRPETAQRVYARPSDHHVTATTVVRGLRRMRQCLAKEFLRLRLTTYDGSRATGRPHGRLHQPSEREGMLRTRLRRRLRRAREAISHPQHVAADWAAPAISPRHTLPRLTRASRGLGDPSCLEGELSRARKPLQTTASPASPFRRGMVAA
jgi:hypothetical protein